MWNKDLWTDATQINLNKSDGKRRGWREKKQQFMTRGGNSSVKHGGAALMGFWVSHLIELHSAWWRPAYRQKPKNKKAVGQTNAESNLVCQFSLSLHFCFSRGVIDRHTPKSLWMQMDGVAEQHSAERQNVNTQQCSDMSEIICTAPPPTPPSIR